MKAKLETFVVEWGKKVVRVKANDTVHAYDKAYTQYFNHAPVSAKLMITGPGEEFPTIVGDVEWSET